jgi:syntaxin 1B/2/3
MQIFKQTRRGEARSALQEVQARHTEIQRIEKTIVELADLFNQMEQLVNEQQTMVDNIDARGEEVVLNVDKAQGELGGAVEKARAARRKKWWCLLIARKSILFPSSIISAFLFLAMPHGIPFPYSDFRYCG